MRNFVLGASIVFVVGFFGTNYIKDVSAQSDINRFQAWAIEADLLAADTTRVLVPALTGVTRYVVTVNCTVLTSAAQAVDVESSDAAVEVLRIPLSGTGQHRLQLINGIALPISTGLRIQPAAAGPAVHCVAEGYNRGVQ